MEYSTRDDTSNIRPCDLTRRLDYIAMKNKKLSKRKKFNSWGGFFIEGRTTAF